MKAFPVTDQHNANINEGMDLRDYFAAKAMQGIISFDANEVTPDNVESFCVVCYLIADAMMEARKK